MEKLFVGDIFLTKCLGKVHVGKTFHRQSELSAHSLFRNFVCIMTKLDELTQTKPADMILFSRTLVEDVCFEPGMSTIRYAVPNEASLSRKVVPLRSKLMSPFRTNIYRP